MRYVTVKRASEVKLKGVKVELDVVNDVVKGVTFTDADGSVVRAGIENYSNFSLQVPAPPKSEEKYVVRGELPVVGKVVKTFDDKYEADKAARELESINGDHVSVNKEKVPVDEEGVASVDDIPF